MKSAFNEQAGRRMAGWSAFLFLSGLIFAPFAARGANALWDSQDYGAFFTSPPLIDATNFINRGTWDIFVSPYPFRTSDTLTYTNKGVMTAAVGWAFDLGPASSGSSLTLRSTSGMFFNDNNGVIQAVDLETVASLSGASYASYLWVDATNIINRGALEAGSSGQILLIGTNITLTRSSVSIVPTTSASSGSTPFFTTVTNVVPVKGFTYQYWGQTNVDFASSNLWNGTNIVVPTFNVTELVQGFNPCSQREPILAATNRAVPGFTFYNIHSNGFVMATNSLGPNGTPYQTTVATNIVHEVVFILPPANANNLSGDVRYTPSLNTSNYFDTVTVQLVQSVTNLVTLSPQANTFYLLDSLASTTNGGFFLAPPNASSICSDPTAQPRNYLVSRADFFVPNVLDFNNNNVANGFAFAGGLPGTNGLPPTNFFFAPQWTNNTVTAKYAALDTSINNITTLPPAGSSIDHAGGRVQIQAGNLTLSQTRMSGEGWIDIQCRHLVDSVGAVVDCQNLSFDVGSTNGSLVFTNLAASSVTRFQGNLPVWSATWSNLTSVIIANNYGLVVTNSVTNLVQMPLTNIVQMGMYVMVLDASQLGAPVPVTVLDLHLHATNTVNQPNNIVLGDPVVVNTSIFIDGTNLGFTIQNSLQLTGNVQNWLWTEAPGLRYFTNNGGLTVPNNAHFGDDGPTNYLSFVNNGIIIANGQTIDSASLQLNNGSTNLAFDSDFTAIALTGQLTGATIQAQGAINFSANDLQINSSMLSAYDAINFTAANSLSDGGIGSGNTFVCENGFNLWSRPVSATSGDLLGTTIFDVALGQAEVYHFWAGQDAGVSSAGYTNHTAVGTLVLFPASSVLEPLFAFYGTTGGNALYVDHLDLSNLTDTNITKELYIDSSLTIYFASAILNPNVNTNGFSSAEAYLDNNANLFGSHLRWVSGVVGLSNIKASAASGKFHLTAVAASSGNGFQLAETILPAQTNIIEASTDLMNWIPIYTNIGSYTNVGVSTITDTAATNYPVRFYRAVPGP